MTSKYIFFNCIEMLNFKFHEKLEFQIFGMLTSIFSLDNKSLTISTFSFSIAANKDDLLILIFRILLNIIIFNPIKRKNLELNYNKQILN